MLVYCAHTTQRKIVLFRLTVVALILDTSFRTIFLWHFHSAVVNMPTMQIWLLFILLLDCSSGCTIINQYVVIAYVTQKTSPSRRLTTHLGPPWTFFCKKSGDVAPAFTILDPRWKRAMCKDTMEHPCEQRIPVALQAVFLASNRGKEVNEPPPDCVASKTFAPRRSIWKKMKSKRFLLSPRRKSMSSVEVATESIPPPPIAVSWFSM